MANSLSSNLEDLHLTNSVSDGISSSDKSANTFLEDPDAHSLALKATVDDLVKRCTTLHQEVEAYVAAVDGHYRATKSHNIVEYRSLRNDFKNELGFLKKLLNAHLSEEKVRHYTVSSNLVYYEALWDAAKRTSGLLSFRKYFFWNRQKEGHGPKGLSLSKGAQTKGKSAALVDIVAKDGMEWVRVSTVSEKRLLFDLAKLGWQNDSDDSDEDMPDAPVSNWEDEDDDDEVDIVKSARELARAARANPIRGRPPRVHVVLTRITSGRTKEVDVVLQKIRATGAIVQCANELTSPSPFAQVLPNLLVDHSRDLSEILNIDCTILLALISDISHRQCPILDWYPGEVCAQIKEEEKEKLLPTHLYPAIGAHGMVCTQEAADQMILIVNTLATDTEKRRANLLLAQNDCQGMSADRLRQAWAGTSDHAVPEGFALPVNVVPGNLEYGNLPAVSRKIARELSPLNKAIFFYGWAKGLTTLSSNRARARQIDSIINEHGLEDGEAGPHIWLCGESRSLIAKQGRRR
jgi:hypothetical protein